MLAPKAGPALPSSSTASVPRKMTPAIGALLLPSVAARLGGG